MTNNVTKKDLSLKIAEQFGLTKAKAHDIVSTVFQSIVNANAEGQTVQIIGFGSFDVREREARKGRNPQTGEEITIQARKTPAFKAGKGYKEAINK